MKLGRNFFLILFTRQIEKHGFSVAFFPIGITCDFEKRLFGLVRTNFILANFNIYISPDTSAKCIILVAICLGMGATKFNFFGPLIVDYDVLE